MKIIVLLVNCALGIPYIKNNHSMAILQKNIINFMAPLHWRAILKAHIGCYSNNVSEWSCHNHSRASLQNFWSHVFQT